MSHIVQSGNKYDDINVGLIFVKCKVTEKGVRLSTFGESDHTPSCKLHDKWIVVAGNNHNINVENKEEPCSSLIKENENNQSPRRFCLDINHTSIDILDQPLLLCNIVEMHLDSVFKDKPVTLFGELFKCLNLRVLSLRHNNLRSLPADVGRLSQLESLVLTDNSLTFNTIPFTLTFCQQLTELYLDHNLLDALPGFLLEMPQLQTVYRHGNHNYFKSTFLWYHTREENRVIEILRPNQPPAESAVVYQPPSLELLAIKTLIATKINFFIPGLLPVTLQDYVAKVYMAFKICDNCGATFSHNSKPGFRVFTFKNPYLGNTCVPFEHWTCSQECGVRLEEPAHREERLAARRMDLQYQMYIQGVQQQFCQKPRPKKQRHACVVT